MKLINKLSKGELIAIDGKTLEVHMTEKTELKGALVSIDPMGYQQEKGKEPSLRIILTGFLMPK